MAFQISQASIVSEKESIIKLWKRNLPVLKESRFEWFYFDNSAGQSKTIIAKKDNESVVGSGSYFVREFQIRDKFFPVAVAADYSIDDEYRLFGPAMGIQRKLVELIKNEKKLIGAMAFPNKAGMGVFKRVGYQLLGDAEFWSKPISVQKFIRKKMGNNIFTLIFSKVANFFLFLISIFNKRKIPNGWYFNSPNKFNDDIDHLWEEAKKKYDVTPVRGSSILNWRYIDNPVNSYQILQLHDEEHKLLGYVIYKRIKNFLEIVDLFSLRDEKIFDILLQKMFLIGKSENKDSICLNFISDNDFKNSLKRNGFKYKPEVQRPLLIIFDSEELLIPERWFIFEGDMDL